MLRRPLKCVQRLLRVGKRVHLIPQMEQPAFEISDHPKFIVY